MKIPLLLLLLGLPATLTLHAQETADTHIRRGDSLIRLDMYKEALASYDRAISLDAKQPTFYAVRGKLLAMLGEVERGRKDLQKAIELDSNCSACYVAESYVAAGTGDVKGATTLVNRAIALDRNNVEAYLLRGQLRQTMGMGADALVDFNTAGLRNPNDIRVMLAKANYYLALGDRITALNKVNDAIWLDSTDFDALLLRTRLSTDMQKLEHALGDITRCIALRPRSAQSYGIRGTIHAHMNHHTDALADYDTAISLEPSSWFIYMNRSMVRYSMEDMDGACADGRRALELAGSDQNQDPGLQQLQRQLGSLCDPTKVAYFYQRGIAAYNKGTFDAAVSIYNDGLKKFPKHLMMIYFRGNAHLAGGRFKEAVHDYDSSLANAEALARVLDQEQNNSSVPRDVNPESVNMLKVGILVDRGNAKASMDDFDGALGDYNRAMILSADIVGDARAHLFLVRGLLELSVGNSDNAQRDFDQSIAINPNEPAAHINRAIAIMNRVAAEPIRIEKLTFSAGRSPGGMVKSISFPIPASVQNPAEVDLAIASCSKAISLDPTMARAYAMRGYARLIRGDQEGCVDLRRAFDLGDESAVKKLLLMCR